MRRFRAQQFARRQGSETRTPTNNPSPRPLPLRRGEGDVSLVLEQSTGAGFRTMEFVSGPACKA
jgi:hypothetical protein